MSDGSITFRQEIETGTCRECESNDIITKVDSSGDYQICGNCGLRQDGIGILQQRFGRIF